MNGNPFIYYLCTAHLPCNIGFTIIKKDYDKEVKRLGIIDPPAFVDYRASTKTFRKSIIKNGFTTTIIVTIDPKDHPKSVVTISLIAHESVHVFCSICEAMGEEDPSEEFSAYCIQWLVQCFLNLYEIQWKKLKRR
jgi:hypothetical protein